MACAGHVRKTYAGELTCCSAPRGTWSSVRVPLRSQLLRRDAQVRSLPDAAPDVDCFTSGIRAVYDKGVHSSHAQPQPSTEENCSRRSVLLASASLPLVLPTLLPLSTAAVDAADATIAYSDADEKFVLRVPEGWVNTEGLLDGNASFTGSSGLRRTVAWYKEDDPSINVTVVLTTVGADYTSMGSFGSPYEFGSGLVGSMDRSYLLRQPEWARRNQPIQVAKLIESKDLGGNPKSYFIEYTVLRPNGDFRHLYSLVTLGFNGVYNRLYTVTAQCSDEEVGQYGPMLDQVVKSFRPDAKQRY